MAQDMRGRSWRSLAGVAAARLAPIKDYLVQRDPRPTRGDPLPNQNGFPDGATKRPSWTQRLARRSNSDSDDVATTEKVVLLPGWASRRYHPQVGPSNNFAGAPYDIEIFVSGYVVKHKTSGVLSRSQRTLLRLAKRFAYLPKLPGPSDSDEDDLPGGSQALSKSTESLLERIELPPRPDEITPELEKLALRHPQHGFTLGTVPTPTPSRPSSPSLTSVHSTPEMPSARSLKALSNAANGVDVLRWHSNLETRLRPFWVGVLSNRTLVVSVRPYFDLTEAEAKFSSPSELARLEKPLNEQSATTDVNGAFKMRIFIPWNTLCSHPRGAPIASADTNHEHDFSVTAELLPPPPPSRQQTPNEYCQLGIPSPPLCIPTAIAEERVPLTHCPIRVISDIDDTVKLSGVTHGARAAFRNVFVKELEENVIPGMGEWYSEMWRRGVRFHYVSNGPFELLPVINDFFRLAQLPTGSVRLRSYGTRSLFSGLLSAPAERKRDGVVEVLKSFPESSFILIGDSGEQDLELYANVAKEYPHQILCIFIRDVNIYEDGQGGIEDPTGNYVRDGTITVQDLQAKRKGSSSVPAPRGGRLSPKSTSSQLPPPPPVSRASSGTADGPIPALLYGAGPKLYTDPQSSEPGSDGTPQPLAASMLIARTPNSESDKQRLNLQIRLWKACTEAPANTVIRVFREPQECVEAFQVILG
ncbi:hypothetical protein BJY52DRAFT_824562 [Lactarius psammicola]|nr:hypothetical protein BJY52DRAFT_824562 [Lactarius psammicola]